MWIFEGVNFRRIAGSPGLPPKTNGRKNLRFSALFKKETHLPFTSIFRFHVQFLLKVVYHPFPPEGGHRFCFGGSFVVVFRQESMTKNPCLSGHHNWLWGWWVHRRNTSNVNVFSGMWTLRLSAHRNRQLWTLTWHSLATLVLACESEKTAVDRHLFQPLAFELFLVSQP